MPDDPSDMEYDWGQLVPRFVHPIKVAIIETMFYMKQQLSASDLQELFCGEYPLSNIHYHLLTLKRAALVVKMREVQRRGATESFFMLREQ